MVVRLSGKEIVAREVQLTNVLSAMLLIFFGMVICVKELQPLNASVPMAINELGSVTDVRFGQLVNTLEAIVFTPSFRTTSLSSLHSRNAFCSMELHDAGIVMEVSLLQYRNASFLIVFKEEGSEIEVSA